MYAFMYVDPETIPAEDNFPATKNFVDKYKKISTPGLVPKIALDLVTLVQNIMGYIRTLMKQNLKKYITQTTIKLHYFAKILWSLRKNGLMMRI